jgi:predicted transcriptional regulator
MKSTLLLSVHTPFADRILAGTKRVELRRRLPRAVDTVLLYATSPKMALVGSFTVESILRLPLGKLWRRVRDIAGITRAEFLDYFNGLTEGVGIFVEKAKRFDQPIYLSELRAFWPGFHPPQGFRYLDEEAVELLRFLWTPRGKIAA